MTWYGGRQAAKRDKQRRAGARRRAREVSAAGELPPLTLAELWVRDNGLCALCKLPVPRPGDTCRAGQRASVEHRVPISKGGVDEPGNQQLAHASCNSEKGARTQPRRKGLRRSMWRRKPKTKHEIPDDAF